nr:DUF2125 domain-containing protein [Ameyamaea chiangmaiensis]
MAGVGLVLVADTCLWALGLQALRHRLDATIGTIRDAGGQADYAEARRGGWPFAATLTLVNPRVIVRIPSAGHVGWGAPTLRLALGPFSPTRLRLSTDGPQAVLPTADGDASDHTGFSGWRAAFRALGPQRVIARALVVTVPWTGHGTTRIDVRARSLDAPAWPVALQGVSLAIRPDPIAGTFTLRLTVRDGTFPDGSPSPWPLHDLDAAFGVSTDTQQTAAVALRTAVTHWGPMTLHMAGQLHRCCGPDAVGDATLIASHVRDAADALSGAGALPPDLRAVLLRDGGRVPDPVQIPLSVRSGTVLAGTLPLRDLIAAWRLGAGAASPP